MTLDARAAATATRLLDKFGKAMTLTIAGSSSYSPSTGEVTSTGQQIEFMGIVESPSATELSSGQVLATDKVVTMNASTLTAYPVPNDALIIDGRRLSIKQVSEVWSGSKIVLFKVVVSA